VRTHAPTSTHKKVVVVLLDGTALKGYLNPVGLGQTTQIALLTPSGEHNSIHLEEVKGVYFVREFTDGFEPERKIFMSRPKLDGLWVRLCFRDEDVLEGIVGNNLLDLLDAGVQITPPDLHGNTLRMFVPRSALTEMKVLGVVGVARRTPQGRRAIDPKIAAAQSKLFRE
jgi:uncharacterized protein DUF6982